MMMRLTAVMVLVLGSTALATVLPLVNADFESGAGYPGVAVGWGHSGVTGIATVDTSAAGWNTLPSGATTGATDAFFFNVGGGLGQGTSHVIEEGKTYTLTCDMGAPLGYGQFTQVGLGLRVNDGVSFPYLDQTIVPVSEFVLGGWITRSCSFTADATYAGQTMYVEFYNYSSLQPHVDNFELDVIPEPATMTMMFLGGLTVLKRRLSGRRR